MTVQRIDWTRIIQALLSGASAADAGALVGISGRTVQRLKNNPEFAELYQSMKASRDARTERDADRARERIDVAGDNIAKALERTTMKALLLVEGMIDDHETNPLTMREVVGAVHIGVQRLGDVRGWFPEPPEEDEEEDHSVEALIATLVDCVPPDELRVLRDGLSRAVGD